MNLEFDDKIPAGLKAKIKERHPVVLERITSCSDHLDEAIRESFLGVYRDKIIRHAPLPPGKNAVAEADIGGREMRINLKRVSGESPDVVIDRMLAHEVMHLAGYRHIKQRWKDPARYARSEPVKAETCVTISGGGQDPFKGIFEKMDDIGKFMKKIESKPGFLDCGS